MMSENYPQEASVQMFFMSYCQSLHRGNNYITESVNIAHHQMQSQLGRFTTAKDPFCVNVLVSKGNKQTSHQFQTQEMQTPK